MKKNHRYENEQWNPPHDHIYMSQLEAWLSECYRLSGADPDGNEDWRLAPRAVEEVRRVLKKINKDR